MTKDLTKDRVTKDLLEIHYQIEKKSSTMGRTKTYIHFFNNDNSKLTLKSGMNLLMKNEAFRKLVSAVLRSIPGTFMWKLTAINRKADYDRKDKYFKFVLIDTKYHHEKQDESSFMNQFANQENYVSKNFIFFKSPSGNGLLVPLNRVSGSKHVYTHFSNFIKTAPNEQVNEFWKVFADLFVKYIKNMAPNEKLFVNTHGHAVPWLHVRFDVKPTYVVWN